MSKSLWNFIDPQDIVEGAIKSNGERKFGYGAEVFRLWTAKNDTDKDLQMNDKELQILARELKEIRNVFWIMISHLYDFDPTFTPSLGLVEKLMLLKLYDFLIELEVAYDNYNYADAYEASKRFI